MKLGRTGAKNRAKRRKPDKDFRDRRPRRPDQRPRRWSQREIGETFLLMNFEPIFVRTVTHSPF
ncbi:hypothetical protein HanIR_Chr03g0145191 [Helianthus annuus]|nr:hypothetical protein HanIR_Chr03g0145191 [Helianthus annuus]